MMDSARRQELRELCSGSSDQGRLYVLECLDEIDSLMPVVIEQAAKIAKQELALDLEAGRKVWENKAHDLQADIERLLDERTQMNESWNERCKAAELKVRLLMESECTCDIGEGKHGLDCIVATLAAERDEAIEQLGEFRRFIAEVKENVGNSRMLRELFQQGPE